MRAVGCAHHPLAMVILCVCMSKIFPNSKYNRPLIAAESTNGGNPKSAMRNTDLELPPLVSWTICKTLPRLTKNQRSLCRKYPDVTLVALQGLEMAMQECQYQFRNHRWNCSSPNGKHKNPRNSALLKKGYREASFTNAISAAGIAHSVAKACSMGKLTACGCEPNNNGLISKDETFENRIRYRQRKSNRNRWKWGGCSHNMNFGLHFSAEFLDGKDKQAGDIQSSINLHNYEAGRVAVSAEMQVRCKCHGMSGSCQLKTCWRSTPDFRMVGDTLKERFRNAVMVDQSNLGNGSPVLADVNPNGRRRRSRYNNDDRRRNRYRNHYHPNYDYNDNLADNDNGGEDDNDDKKFRRKKRKRTSTKRRSPSKKSDFTSQLLYYQKSPSFCEPDVNLDVAGTVGRLCNRTSRGIDNCSSLCCGRGYNIVKRKKFDRCNCRFEWCCYVVCQNCTIDQWITVCK